MYFSVCVKLSLFAFSFDNFKTMKIIPGWVVRKLVNTNPGLKVNPKYKFFLLTIVFRFLVFVSLRLLKFKSERQKYKQKTSPKSRKTQIKILVNPGLA